jgi:hypothetical protein
VVSVGVWFYDLLHIGVLLARLHAAWGRKALLVARRYI